MALCASCHTIDLSVFNRLEKLHVTPADRGLPLRQLPLVSDWNIKTCPLCQLLHDLYSRYPEHQDDIFVLVATTARHISKWLPRNSANLHQPEDYGILAIETSPGSWSPLKHPYIALDPKHLHLRDLPLVKPKADFSKIRDWVEQCTKRHQRKGCHTQLQSYKSWEPKDVYRVVDCDKQLYRSRKNGLVMRNGFPGMVYVALSYLWGSDTASVGLKDTRASKNTPLGIENVIGDAMEVVQSLGLRYLWVDKHCINQLDDADKGYQIAQMDKIYRNACLTIIAGAGDGPDHGLPGIRERRVAQNGVIGTRKAYVVPAHPINNLVKSKWNSRGWTYQEAVLSARRLVFTEDEALFHCDSMSCREMAAFPSWDSHLFTSFHPLTLSDESLLRHIEQYSRRQLTMPSNVLDAFQAIFRTFETDTTVLVDASTPNPNPIKLQRTYSSSFTQMKPQQIKLPKEFWGVPFLKTRFYASSQGQFLGPPRGSERYDVPFTAKFVKGLGWGLKRDGTATIRREDFPTWSWAGWISPTKYRSENENWMSDWVPDPDFVIHPWLLGKYGNDISPFKHFTHLIASRPNHHNLAPTIYVDAWTVAMKFEAVSSVQSTTARERSQSKFLPYLEVDSDLSTELGKRLAARILEGRWQCIVIGYSIESYIKCAFPIVLVCEWNNDIARRIGIVRMVDWKWESEAQTLPFRAHFAAPFTKVAKNWRTQIRLN